MKNTLLSLALLAGVSAPAYAVNDVYGTVDELILRSEAASDDHQIYFRMKVHKESATYASCISDTDSLTWYLDLSSPVAKLQYELLLNAYKEQLPLRIVGKDDVCKGGTTDSDNVYEISPWNWQVVEQKPSK